MNRNLAACYARLGDWKEVVRVAEGGLEVEGGDVKLLWRLGMGYVGLGKYGKAVEVLEKGLKVCLLRITTFLWRKGI